MTTIIIYGNKSDTSLQTLFTNKLSETYSITYFNYETAISKGSGYNLLVLDCEQLRDIDLSECILILKSDSIPSNIKISRNTIIIANSDNQSQLQQLSPLTCPTITCGHSEKDTIAYSSLTSDSVQITLNRRINALSGRVIEPLEFPLEITEECDIYSMLAFAAVRLLLDDNKWDIEKLY